MSSIAQLLGAGDGPVSSIVNYYSGGSVQGVAYTSNLAIAGRGVNSGALTANTLATVYSLTGRGCLRFFSAFANDTTSRTIRVKVTVDGTSIFDATSSAITTTNNGIVAVGSLAVTAAGAYVPQMQPIVFQSSLLIQIASSLTETDKIGTLVNYENWA